MQILENISLKPYNTFGIDAKADRMVIVEPGDDLCGQLPLADGQPYIILGGGSDMLFTADYHGTVLKLSPEDPDGPSADGVMSRAWGGMVMDDLVQWSLDNGLYGMENLSAIPGTVGAAAVQNMGAYGVEAKDIIESVEVFDIQLRKQMQFTNAECGFAYRDSLFKHTVGRYLVLWVTFRLQSRFVANLSYKALEGLPHTTADELRRSITDLRWQKLPRPEEYGSAGSFFKNPVVDEPTYMRLKAEFPDMPDAHAVGGQYKLSAGWLIDRAGWKGRTQGGAGVWPKNALVLYNTGSCTGSEVTALSKAIQDDIAARFGVALIPEAIIV